jgi:hypothetical protein
MYRERGSCLQALLGLFATGMRERERERESERESERERERERESLLGLFATGISRP